MATTLGVLAAGGAGARLGLGAPKALARLGGVALLDRALAILAAVCDEIVVSLPRRLELPLPGTAPSAGAPRPVRRVDDPPGRVGPLAGIVAGLASSPFARAVVLGVDLPFVEPAALEAMLSRIEDHHAVVPAPGGIPQPLAAAYAPAAGPILAARLAEGERYLLHAIRALDALVLDDGELAELPGGAQSFFNLNTPADLAEAEKRMAARVAR